MQCLFYYFNYQNFRAHEGTSTDTNTLETATTSSTLKEKIKTVTRSKSSDLLRSTKKMHHYHQRKV